MDNAANRPLAPTSTDDVTEAVLGASQALVAVAARSIAAVAPEVTLPQFRALVVLAQSGRTTMGSLAEALGVHRSTATRLCDRLVARGLARRTMARHDRREVTIALTPAGRRLTTAVTGHRRREIARVVRRIPTELRPAVVAGLGAFAAAAGEAPAQSWSLGWSGDGREPHRRA